MAANKPKTAYFMFGRFNPPTIGHVSIFRKLADDASADGADAFVFVSSSHNVADGNPLTVDQKMYYLEKVYTKNNIQFINTTECPLGSGEPCTNVNAIIKRLREIGYNKIVMYVGSDRLKDFEWIHSTNVKKGMKYPVEIVNKMPPRTSNNFVARMSATKIRQAARNGDLQMIIAGTGLSEKNAIKLRDEIRAAYNELSRDLSQIHISKKSRKKGGYIHDTYKRSHKRSTCKSNKK